MSMLGNESGRSPLFWVLVVVAWLWVAVPFGYGLFQLLLRIPALFSG